MLTTADNINYTFSRLELKYLAELIVFQAEDHVKGVGPLEHRRAVEEQLLECSSEDLSNIASLFNSEVDEGHP